MTDSAHEVTVLRKALCAALDPDVTALVADHKAGQEAVEMLNWLDANWDYAIGEPPLCVTQPKSLRDAIRAAMKGGRT